MTVTDWLKRALKFSSCVIAMIFVSGYLLRMASSASTYASVPSWSRNGASSMKSIPICMPAAPVFTSASARMTAREALTFSPPDFEAYGRRVFPYSLISTSRVAFSPSLPFVTLSRTNSTPIFPPVMLPRMLLAVSVIYGMTLRMIWCGTPSCPKAVLRISYLEVFFDTSSMLPEISSTSSLSWRMSSNLCSMAPFARFVLSMTSL